jgi:hypothetical protein
MDIPGGEQLEKAGEKKKVKLNPIMMNNQSIIVTASSMLLVVAFNKLQPRAYTLQTYFVDNELKTGFCILWMRHVSLLNIDVDIELTREAARKHTSPLIS